MCTLLQHTCNSAAASALFYNQPLYKQPLYKQPLNHQLYGTSRAPREGEGVGGHTEEQEVQEMFVNARRLAVISVYNTNLTRRSPNLN